MRKKQVFRPCTKCGGTGEVLVSHNMATTLAALEGGATLREIAKKTKTNLSTANARISRLLTQGLVKRTEAERSGRTGMVYLYHRV